MTASTASNEKEVQELNNETETMASSTTVSVLKLAAASMFLWSAMTTFMNNANNQEGYHGRRLTEVIGDSVPAYMKGLMKDLKERKKLFDETPAEEVKYWFEYTGELQVSL